MSDSYERTVADDNIVNCFPNTFIWEKCTFVSEAVSLPNNNQYMMSTSL